MEKVNLLFKKLVECGVQKYDAGNLWKLYGDAIKVASFGMREDSGCAGEGQLVETVLFTLTPFALKVNEIYPEEMRADRDSVIKVCLLQHISKCERLVKQYDEWRQNRLGEVFTFADDIPAIGIGLHSMTIANRCGITFTPVEAEAMTIIDRDADDKEVKYHSSVLSQVVRTANEMTYLKCQEQYKQIKLDNAR